MTLARSPHAVLQRRRVWLSLVLRCVLSTAGWATGHCNTGGVFWCNSWNATSLASAALLRQSDFVSATDGWITDETRILLTRDGGRNWSPEARLPDLRLLGTLDFVDLRNGWATGGPQIYRTADGGQTWTVFTPVLASAGGAEVTPVRWSEFQAGGSIACCLAVNHD